MKIYNESLLVEFRGLKLDNLSQPDFTKISQNYRAESGELILYFYWVPMHGLEGFVASLGVGYAQRELPAKQMVETLVSFEPGDKVNDFLTALTALKIIYPKDYQVLV